MNGRFLMLGKEGVAPHEAAVMGGALVADATSQEADRYLVPGFVDVHIHGAFGIDFMSATSEEMLRLADRLGDCGYERFFPTTVSSNADSVLQAIGRLPDDPRIPGFHLEGPFISPDFPGAQPPEAIVEAPAPGSAWDAVLEHPKLKLMTLAPERPGAEALIGRLKGRTRFSMGHTNATYAEARSGFQSGVRHATHTFNAMRGLHHREPGALGFVLDEPEIGAELIYDRLHVCREAASILFRCKGPKGVIAVSDGTMAAGLPDGSRLKMWGHNVETRNGGVYLAGADTLAGSAITLLDAFRNLAVDFGPEIAIRSCCLNPRSAMGLSDAPQVWIEFDRGFRLLAVHRID